MRYVTIKLSNAAFLNTHLAVPWTHIQCCDLVNKRNVPLRASPSGFLKTGDIVSITLGLLIQDQIFFKN